MGDLDGLDSKRQSFVKKLREMGFAQALEIAHPDTGRRLHCKTQPSPRFQSPPARRMPLRWIMTFYADPLVSRPRNQRMITAFQRTPSDR